MKGLGMAAMFCLFAGSAGAGEPLRTDVCLNGTWELTVDGIDQPAEVRVPGSFSGQDQLWGKDHWDVWGYPKNWYNRAAVYHKTLDIPEELDNQRVLIHFGGVRHVVRVMVNGQEAGSWSDSYVPFAFDITDLVHAGENSMQVHIAADRTCGLFEDYNANRRGIYQDVFLKFVPEVRVTPDNFIRTSVSQSVLEYDVPVRNDSAAPQTVSLRFKVLDAEGRIVQRWADQEQMTLAPGEEKIFQTSRHWKNPHLWSIDDPYLYHLETEVVSGNNMVLDRYRLRFGFREISWENQNLYLNGREIFLRGHGGHPQGDLQHSKEYAEGWIRQLKEQGVELMRLHDFPRNDEIYEAADEMGFLFLSEAAHHFRLPAKEVGLAHVERMVKRLRNHPSILMWSVANELHWRNFEEPAYLIELCRKLDPTRPAYNSDFSGFSLHGDVIAHHYDAANIWKDWEKYGPDKVMVWDEIGNVWQQDRPLKTGPAGIEIRSQDVATGTWRDGWEELRKDIQVFCDGQAFNDSFYRVNAYVPWELSYSFYRFQPFNNFQRMDLDYDQIEGTEGMKLKFINPCATTINIWDPTLPANQPNPALYCFNEYMERVRFPDDPKERTFFSGEIINRNGRLFYEDHRPADFVEFRVETLDGKVLTSTKQRIALDAGEYVSDFPTKWALPKVNTLTPVRLVRQFSYKGDIGYCKTDESKIFPAFQPVNLAAQKVSVEGDALQKLFGGAGVSVAQARVIIAETYNPAWDSLVAAGARVLVQPFSEETGKKQLSHYNMVPKGNHQSFTGSVENFKMPENITLNFGTPGQERSTLTTRSFNIENPMPGAWVTLGFDGTIDFSQTGLIQLAYGLWTPLKEGGHDKPWNDAGGAPFFQKTVRFMLSDASGRWFVCTEQGADVMTREFPTALYGMLELDCLLLSWKPVRLESGQVVELEENLKPDFSRVSAFGLLFDETNPGSPVQINSITMRGGAEASATVQPGGISHGLLTGLGQEDFSFWRGGSSSRTIAMPEGRNVRRILMGNKDGIDSALQETFIGRGIVLESALNVGNMDEPMAGFMLNRMVAYLSRVQSAPKATGISVPGGGPLADWMSELGADLAAESSIVAIDARNAEQLMTSKPQLIRTLDNGGTVLFSEVTAETIETVRDICGQPLRLTDPFFGQLYKCIKAPVSWARIGSPTQWVDYYDGIMAPYPFEPNFNPLLAGISNFDLDWKKVPMFRNGVEVEGMNPVSASADHQVLISNWHIGSEPTDHLYGEQLNGVRDLRQNSWFVNRDAVVLELAVGTGRVVISQLDLAAGGAKAQRIMQTLLTNLGVSFDGAMPPPSQNIYDSNPRKDQLARFAVYDMQIDPVQRQYYGTPKVLPDYLKDTQILAAADAGELPLMGFFGDPLTLSMNKPLEQALSGVVRMDKPGVLHGSRSAGGALKKQIGDATYARVAFSVGQYDSIADTTDAEYRAHLEAIWKVLSEHSKKIYWLPIPAAFGNDEPSAVRAQELNQIAEDYFEGKDVYKIPFVYGDTKTLPQGFFSGDGEKFSPAEATVLAKRLAEAVISFGAQ
jgi:hypothetical protein